MDVVLKWLARPGLLAELLFIYYLLLDKLRQYILTRLI